MTHIQTYFWSLDFDYFFPQNKQKSLTCRGHFRKVNLPGKGHSRLSRPALHGKACQCGETENDYEMTQRHEQGKVEVLRQIQKQTLHKQMDKNKCSFQNKEHSGFQPVELYILPSWATCCRMLCQWKTHSKRAPGTRCAAPCRGTVSGTPSCTPRIRQGTAKRY